MIDGRRTIGKDCVKKHIIEIGQDLINRAEEISNNIDNVRDITIYALLNPEEIVNYSVTKKYGVNAIIHDEDEKELKNE